MRRNPGGFLVLPALGAALSLIFLATPAPAGADDAAKKLQQLSALTGSSPMQGALKELLTNKDGTKKLVADAAPLVKSKKVSLTYNGALVLALAASDVNDLASSEVFFRVCMDQAAKLQSPQKLLQAYGGLIDLLYDNKKFAESARVCQELLELKTDDEKPRIVLRAYTTRFGDTDFNEQEGFSTTERLRGPVHRLLIQAVTKQGKFEQALSLIDTLIKAQDHWLERQLKGWVLREAGKFEEAAKVYEDVLARIAKDRDLEPEDKDRNVERNRYILSNVYVDLKQIDKASTYLQQLLEKKPDDPGYHNDLGYIWADNDVKLEEAEKLIRRALDLDRKRRKANPDLKAENDHDNGAYLDSLGWVLFKLKSYKEAKEALLDAVKDKTSQHIEIYDHLGDVLMMLGEREAALAAWRKGLEVVGEGRREMERKTTVEKKIEKHK